MFDKFLAHEMRRLHSLTKHLSDAAIENVVSPNDPRLVARKGNQRRGNRQPHHLQYLPAVGDRTEHPTNGTGADQF